MELKSTVELVWESLVEAIIALIVAQYFPAMLDRAKAAWVVVGGKLADLGWWMKENWPGSMIVAGKTQKWCLC